MTRLGVIVRWFLSLGGRLAGTVGGGPGAWLACACYVLLALAATWPLPTMATTHSWGCRFDLWGNLWLLWYLHRALLEGHLAFWTPLIFYPDGFSLWGYGHFGLQILASPLLYFVNLPMAYAVLLWASLSLSALALYLLVQDQVQDRWAAFLAGTLYAFHSLKYAEMSVGSVEQVATFGLPLFALCLLRWHQTGRLRWGVLTWVVIMGTALGNWFFGVALALFTVAFAAFHLVRRDPSTGTLGLDLKMLGRCVALGMLCGITVAPFLVRVQPQILERPPLSMSVLESPSRRPLTSSQAVGENLDQDTLEGVSDYLSQISPQQVADTALRQTVDDSLALDRLLEEGLSTEPRAAGPGFQLVLLAVVGLVLAGRRTRFWLVIFVAFTVLSLGPFLRIHEDGSPSPVVLPYYYLYNSAPLLRVAYRPYRFFSVALMAVAVLAAYGLAGVFRRIPRPLTRGAMAVLLLVSMLVVRWDLCSPDRPVMLVDARVPPLYETLAKDPESFAIIEIPYHHWAFGDSNARFQYYQTLHGKPMLNNSQFINMQQLLRLRALSKAHPLLNTMAEAMYARRIEPPPTLAQDVAWLRQQNFRYIVAHTDFPRDAMHLGGYQEMHQMPTEAFLSFLEGVFGAPTVVPGALVFDVRNSGRALSPIRVVNLQSVDSFEFSGLPVDLSKRAVLDWSMSERRLVRLAFWALAEPGTGAVQVRVRIRQGNRDSIVRWILPLSADRWRRITLSATQLHLQGNEEVRQVVIEGQPGASTAVRFSVANVQTVVESSPTARVPPGSDAPR